MEISILELVFSLKPLQRLLIVLRVVEGEATNQFDVLSLCEQFLICLALLDLIECLVTYTQCAVADPVGVSVLNISHHVPRVWAPALPLTSVIHQKTRIVGLMEHPKFSLYDPDMLGNDTLVFP